MQTYEWILFDADETLFTFDAFKGLQLAFARYGVTFSKQDHDEYEAINQPLWVEYQNGKITADELQLRRFQKWADQLQKSHKELNSVFLTAMADICMPLDGAIHILDTLKGKTKLGIITNGFIEHQQYRLKRHGLENHFDLLLTSEEAGFAKPHRGIFDHALTLMGQPTREKVLMVGDNPASDILGGINSGLHTCWLNPMNKATPDGIIPHYQISSLRELISIIG